MEISETNIIVNYRKYLDVRILYGMHLFLKIKYAGFFNLENIFYLEIFFKLNNKGGVNRKGCILL